LTIIKKRGERGNSEKAFFGTRLWKNRSEFLRKILNGNESGPSNEPQIRFFSLGGALYKEERPIDEKNGKGGKSQTQITKKEEE